MDIIVPEVKRVVDDYDFLFTSGFMMPVTIDREAGDKVDFNKDGITIYLSAKPAQSDPRRLLPAEDITIFSQHLLSVQHRRREVTMLTPDEKREWHKTFNELSGENTKH